MPLAKEQAIEVMRIALLPRGVRVSQRPCRQRATCLFQTPSEPDIVSCPVFINAKQESGIMAGPFLPVPAPPKNV